MNLPNIMIIGLTGNSGAGKSTVREVFRGRGFNVIDCDNIARRVADNPAFLRELDSRFPEELINPDGTLNRTLTAKIIFSNNAIRELYNRIIFPYIIYDVITEIKSVDGNILLDAPTLFEARLDIICDSVVSVTAETEICRARICQRDGISEEQARARIFSQHSAEFFREHSDFVIKNDGTKEQLFEITNYVIDRLKGIK